MRGCRLSDSFVVGIWTCRPITFIALLPQKIFLLSFQLCLHYLVGQLSCTGSLRLLESVRAEDSRVADAHMGSAQIYSEEIEAAP